MPAAFSHFTSLGFDRNRVLFSWDVTVDELHKYYTDVCVKGYDVVRHDRKRSGGGICIYIRKSRVKGSKLQNRMVDLLFYLSAARCSCKNI